ncbi:MAG: peptidoglycan bridge formation glycyltransferase FemA/FemB family protein [Candidatus Liptonbacteria bacterium]|nr:peptidoglycan bridge formation glycyltransferase FemA/FemB family protein [Candidatus Liptonbacteria bacterium]
MNLNDDKAGWNREVVSNPSFLQTWQWGELQKKMGRRVFRINVAGIFASVVEQSLPFGQTYLYAPHGPVAGGGMTMDSWRNLIKAAEGAPSPRKPIFFRVEPLAQKIGGEIIKKVLEEAGFRPTKAVQPKSTLVIDLRKSEKEILDEMEHDTRYSIRAAEKRGVTVKFAEGKNKQKNFDTFWEIFLETNRRHGLKIYSKAYYEEVVGLEGECSSKIGIAESGEKAISAAIFVYFGGRCFYLFAGSRSGYGKFNAPTYLLWRAMLEAKKTGCDYFDFWGISHENKNWTKITAFKKSFGGEEITSAGTWDYVFDRPRYIAYNFAKLFLAG